MFGGLEGCNVFCFVFVGERVVFLVQIAGCLVIG